MSKIYSIYGGYRVKSAAIFIHRAYLNFRHLSSCDTIVFSFFSEGNRVIHNPQFLEEKAQFMLYLDSNILCFSVSMKNNYIVTGIHFSQNLFLKFL